MSYDAESMVVVAIERLNSNMEKMNERHEKFVDKTDSKLDVIQADVNKFVVLFEKLASIEKRQEDTTKRVYHVIEEVKNRVKTIEDARSTSGCPAFAKFQSAHDNELDHNMDRISKLEVAISTLKEKPAKRWELVGTVAITSVIMAAITYVATQIGLK